MCIHNLGVDQKRDIAARIITLERTEIGSRQEFVAAVYDRRTMVPFVDYGFAEINATVTDRRYSRGLLRP